MAGTIFYLVVAAAALVGAIAVRRAGRTPLPKSAAPTSAADIAFLNGGGALATLSALAALRADGLIEGLDGRLVRATGDVTGSQEPLQRAIHAVATESPVRLHSLPGRTAVAREIDVIAKRVGHTGLLDEPAPTGAAGRAWWAPAAAAGLGLVGTLGGWFDGGVITVVIVLAVVAFVLARPRRRARTRAADETLRRLRRDNPHLAPAMRPSWSTYGAEGAALGVALYGEAALRMAEPAFANALLDGPHADMPGGRRRRRVGSRSSSSDGAWPLIHDGGSSSGGWGGWGDGGGGGCGGGS